MSTLSPSLTAESLINLYNLGITTIVKPRNEQITVLCGRETADSPFAAELSFRKLKLYDGKHITPVHVHPAKEKSYLRFSGSDADEITVFIYRDGEWTAFPIAPTGIPVVVPRGTPHALFSTGAVEIMVISSNHDNQIEWEAEEPQPTT